MNILFFIGIALVIGFLGGKFANKFKFPGVIGYLLVGVILGSSVFNVFTPAVLDKLGLFTDFALGIIAFMIGSEMKLSVLKKMGAGIITIIFSESFGAFFLVTLGIYLLTHKLYIALIFGALAPASAPAGTIAVIQEYKAKGPLTSALYTVVGLDDGLAIMIYAFAAAIAKFLITGESISFLSVVKGPIVEILGALLLGGLVGIIAGYFVKRLHNKQEVFTLILGSILFSTGVSTHFHFSLILANMSLGMVFANVFLTANRRAYDAIQSIALPIFIVFFLIAGAHLRINLLPAMGAVGLVYMAARTAGLMSGAYFGAAISKSAPVIRKYLGLGILSQAGVAIGLAVLAAKEFGVFGSTGQNLALLIINTIAATTIIFEIIGPITTKIAITKAGETGKAK